MKLFVAAMACSGKTTLARHLRKVHGVNAVDFDDEIARVNGGTWPDIETKNAVVIPKAFEDVIAMDDVILFHGYMSPDHLQRLRAAGFGVVVLDVSEAELRRRDAQRHAEEGWTNIQWFDHNRACLEEIKASGEVDAVISGDRAVEAVAADVLRIAREDAGTR